jgi:ABC-type multidrug transport system ATPase subunit
MNKGEIISLDTPQKIKSSVGKHILEIVCSHVRKAYKILKDKTDYEVQMFGDRINIMADNSEEDFNNINKLFSNNGIEVTSHREISASLENVFIHLVKD